MKLKKIVSSIALSFPLLCSTVHANDSVTTALKSITVDGLTSHVKTLSSDDYAGRLPTTMGEEKTLSYLEQAFKALGVKPGNGDSYRQAVNLTEITPVNVSMSIAGDNLTFKKDMVIGARNPLTEVSLNQSELVFVGYGINAPEYKWNDYANVDVKGKTVVILVNDPGFESNNPELFTGTTMTYYGRWTYKYDEAMRQGAAGALIVHETAPASYPWSVVENGWGGAKYTLAANETPDESLLIEGWITREMAVSLFKKAGLDFDQAKAKAMQGAYATQMGLPITAKVTSTLATSSSYNFIATIPGSEKADEHVIYSAHWDHLGTDDSLEGDKIYNGAHDNATGTGGIIEIARAFQQLATAPKRSITFLATTAEEQGLLGSKYYVENPVYPIAKTVANINVDSLNILGQTQDFTVVGLGKSEVEDALAKAASRQQRTLSREASPQAGGYYRSDHFNFAKVGVPAIFAGGGQVAKDDASQAYRDMMSPRVKKCYHQTCDEYSSDWNLSGAVDDLRALFETGLIIANDENWPKWYKNSEFQR